MALLYLASRNEEESLDRLSLSGWKKVFLQSWREAGEDNMGLIAAGVAFYGFLALVPLLAAVILTYGMFAEPGTVVHDVKRLAGVMPADAARLIGQQLMELVKASDGKKGLGVVAALAIALFGARNGAASIITALNVAFEVKEHRSFVAVNGLALAITGAAVVTVILGLIAIAALGHLEHLLPTLPEAVLPLGQVVSYALLAGVGMAAAATLYRYGPALDHIRWSWITPGSVLASVSWLVVSLGFGAYAAGIGHYNATYGSLSAVIVVLTWFYFSSYALLFGAELNSERIKINRSAPHEVIGELHADNATEDRVTIVPALALQAAEQPELRMGDVGEVLPLSLAAMGLSLIRSRAGNGKGFALIALGTAAMFFQRRKNPRG